MSDDDDYGLSPTKERRTIEPPAVDYLPPRPREYAPRIGLIGAGGISEFHLKNYRKCGYEVVAIDSRQLEDAKRRRDEFYPAADVTNDYRKLLERNDVDVVDITPHPEDRLPIVRDAIEAGKHILSQKPFVLDVDAGQELVDLAEQRGVKFAVNQNGRWAPHFSYMRAAIAAGLIGEVTSIDFSLQWDQTWIAGNQAFESIHHLILFDFGVHWFDIANCLMAGAPAERVYAQATHFDDQVFRPPAIGAAIITYPAAQVRISFHGHTRLGEEDTTTVVGTRGTLRSRGPGLNDQPQMQVFLEDGECVAPLQGCWFESGFQGTMGELLCAIEDDREPAHSARDNLKSLELCFAALASADCGQSQTVGSVRRVSSE